MSETNRRKFLTVAGAGAAAGTVGLTGVASAAPAASGETLRKPGSAQETVVAYVKDHRSSTLRLMVGEREIVVRDRDLVNRILNAAGGE